MKEQSEIIKKPPSKFDKYLKIVIIALVIVGIIGIPLWIFGVIISSAVPPLAPVPASAPAPAPAPKSEYMLQCLSWSNYTEYGYIHVVGEVKNISNTKLQNVMADVSFRTEDGTLVKTDDALIDYDVLMPGQISSFEVLTTENPAIKKLGLSFKEFLGSQIPTIFD